MGLGADMCRDPLGARVGCTRRVGTVWWEVETVSLTAETVWWVKRTSKNKVPWLSIYCTVWANRRFGKVFYYPI